MADAVRAEQDHAHRAGQGLGALPGFAGAFDRAALDAVPPTSAVPVFHLADDASLRAAADPMGLA
jgi:hypothetical protein